MKSDTKWDITVKNGTNYFGDKLTVALAALVKLCVD